MRFPLSMTARMAGYIFKNKMRPPRQWQKDLAPSNGGANPFQILHQQHNGKAAAHPMIKKRFPLVLMLEPLHACNLTCTG
jgi:hypothetical protein